jgi:putative NADH-flavin reductase
MEILVVGADRGVGSLLPGGALVRGHVVTVFGPATAVATAGARIIAGELADLPALAAAVAGRNAVLYAVEPAARGDGDAPVARGVRAVVRAMRDEGARRLVCLSVGDLGASGRPGLAARLFGGSRGERALAEVRQMEVAVRQSGLDWTIVRVAALNDRPGKHSWRTAPGYAVPHGAAIARADVAEFMLGQLDGRADVGHAVAIAW